MNGNDLSAWDCENAFVFSKMDHSCWFGRIHAQNCKNILTSLDTDSAGHTRRGLFLPHPEQVGIEVNSGQVPYDFNYEYFVLDPDNLLYGSFEYHIVRSTSEPTTPASGPRAEPTSGDRHVLTENGKVS